MLGVSAWELQCMAIAICGNRNCSEKNIVKVSSVRDALCGSCGL